MPIPWIETLGQQMGAQAGGGLLGAAMGLMMEKHNDQRQIAQQQKLTDMQIAGNKQMMEFSSQKQYEMWLKTNYKAQMEQLAKAGLNPGLIYGMAGAGGTTATPTGNVTGGTAQGKAGETTDMTGMGIQMASTAAQIELMKAEANKANADAEATRGYKKEESTATTAGIIQGIENAKAQQALTETNNKIQGVALEFAKGTLEENIQKATAEMRIAQETVDQMEQKTFIDKATASNVVDSIRADLATKLLEQEAIKAGTKLTEAQITKIHEDIKQAAAELGLHERAVKTGEKAEETEAAYKKHEMFINNVRESTKLGAETIGQILGMVGLGKMKH